MKLEHPILDRKRRRGLGIAAGVALAHAGLFALLGLSGVESRFVAPMPAIDVVLINPVPPPEPPPPPPEPPAPEAGGGAPAAPSVVHTPPKPVDRPVEIIAPPVKAPEPALVVGIAPVASPTPGQGLGGEGTGTGTGRGAGDGPGSGGVGPLFLRGPTQGDILTVVPPRARQARQSGRGRINCEIRSDTRLDGCRLVDETPPGFGFGDAALRAAGYFRFRPPLTADGRQVEGQRVTVSVDFGRPGR